MADELPVAFNDFYKENGYKDPGVEPHGPSMTRQEFAEECDINHLMAKYDGRDIGAMMRDALPPVYYDFSSMPDNLMDFMQLQKDAEAAFMTLPALVRREFENNPVQFVDFASNPENLPKMREWGLAAPEKPVQEFSEVPKGEVAPPPSAEPTAV